MNISGIIMNCWVWTSFSSPAFWCLIWGVTTGGLLLSWLNQGLDRELEAVVDHLSSADLFNTLYADSSAACQAIHRQIAGLANLERDLEQLEDKVGGVLDLGLGGLRPSAPLEASEQSPCLPPLSLAVGQSPGSGWRPWSEHPERRPGGFDDLFSRTYDPGKSKQLAPAVNNKTSHEPIPVRNLIGQVELGSYALSVDLVKGRLSCWFGSEASPETLEELMAAASSQPVGAPMRCMEIRGGSRAVEEAFSTPGLSVWLYSNPFDGAERGGDVHYISLCGGGLITRVVVADVSGHGTSVSEFSDDLRTLMRKNINTKRQTRLVEALNRQFSKTAQSLRFATAVVATYLATNRSLTISNASHPRPLWYRAETGYWHSLETTRLEQGNLPLGIDDDSPYHQFTVRLGPGDIVCFYTDALSEATDAAGRMLGEKGLVQLARR